MLDMPELDRDVLSRRDAIIAKPVLFLKPPSAAVAPAGSPPASRRTPTATGSRTPT